MAKATLIKSARKPIYMIGKKVEYVSKRGKREGQTLTKIDRTIPANDQDRIFINVGESYYTWGFMNGGTFYSKTEPRPSQLTSSAFMQTYLSIQETVEDWVPGDASDVESFVADIIEQLEELRDTTQENFDNIPENLQYAPVGEMMQERIDSLDSLISEFECIEVEYDEPDEDDVKTEIADEDDIDTDVEGWEEAISAERLEEKVAELFSDWLSEKEEEIKSIGFELC